MPKRRLKGTVQSVAMDKTAVVQVERLKAHRLYRKVLKRRKRYMAHDEANEARIGDRVVIEECPPISKNKRWQIVEWIRRGED